MQYQKLTSEMVASYLKESTHCPFCQSERICGGRIEPIGDKIYQTISCKPCGREWVDVYHLTTADEEEQVCAVCGEILEHKDECIVFSSNIAHAGCTWTRTDLPQ